MLYWLSSYGSLAKNSPQDCLLTARRHTPLSPFGYSLMEITCVSSFEKFQLVLCGVLYWLSSYGSLAKNSALHCFCLPMVGTLAFEPRYLHHTKTGNILSGILCFRKASARFMRCVYWLSSYSSLAKNSALHCFCLPMVGTLAFEPRYLLLV